MFLLCHPISAKPLSIRCKFIDEERKPISGVDVEIYPYMYYKDKISWLKSKNDSCFLNVPDKGVYYFSLGKEGYHDYWFSLFIDEDVEFCIQLRNQKSIKKDLFIEFDNKNSRVAKIYNIVTEYNIEQQLHGACSRQNTAWNNTFRKVDQLSIGWNTYVQSVRKKIVSEKDSLVRDALRIVLLGTWTQGATIDSTTIVRIINNISPYSLLWVYQPIAMLEVEKLTGKNYYSDIVIKSHPDKWLRAWLMLYQLPFLKTKNDTVKIKKYCSILLRDYKNTDFEKMALPFMITK